jgi:hypothetical protein
LWCPFQPQALQRFARPLLIPQREVETRLADSSDFDLTLLDLALMMASQHFPKPKENYL